MRHVVVIGAGLGGLAAAGRDVTIAAGRAERLLIAEVP